MIATEVRLPNANNIPAFGPQKFIHPLIDFNTSRLNRVQFSIHIRIAVPIIAVEIDDSLGLKNSHICDIRTDHKLRLKTDA